jgi:eukaryotic-like serine/threonine-protein kinase
MTLAAGSAIGGYQVTGLLGKGGMGEVWRARDTRLGREVAIKALPQAFATDPDRLARFEREAKLLASLNHPNIAAVYGLEASTDSRFLVMELVEGETLAERLSRGPLPVDEALRLLLQIAGAIEAAHERDIVHRDLKPANIKITPGGTVKVLDFGLAKAMQGDLAEQSALDSPTLSLAATAQGVILGTAAYMSPEQARGQAVDHRTDVWAFGCVFYEAITGRQAFPGELVSDILASVLAREPELAALPTALGPRLRRALKRCFEKNPRQRWQSVGDLRLEIEQALTTPDVEGPSASGRTRAKTLVLAIGATAVIAGGAAWLLKPAPPAAAPPIVRFQFAVPSNPLTALRSVGFQAVALSPDGRHFAYNTASGVYLRPLDATWSRLIPGTENALSSIFFSPDGEWLAFWRDGAIQKISIGGGAAVPIARSGQSALWGASWGRDGNILFAEGDGIKRVSAAGGPAEMLIPTAAGEQAYGPSLLPDGVTILYTLARVQGPARWDQAEIVAQRPGGPAHVLVRGGSDVVYVPTGHLVYAVGEVLFAVPFDADTLATRGGPVPIVTGVRRAAAPDVNTATAQFGVSAGGTLVYLNAPASAERPLNVLAILDRSGSVRLLDVPKATYRSPRLSSDGRRVAVETITDGGQSAIQVYDLSGTVAMRRLTQEGSNTRPVWNHDGTRIAYGSLGVKDAGIFWQPADGSGLPERLTTAEEGYLHFPESFSPDGRVLVFARVKPPMGGDSWSLWTLRLDAAEKRPELFFDQPAANEFGAQFSPDGKWIAYASNADPNLANPSNRFAIWLQPFPATGVKYEVSQTGGAWPVWVSAGNQLELVYRLNATTGSSRLNAVRITTEPAPAFTSESVLPIQGFVPVVNYREYDAFRDGRRFVVVFPAESPGPAQSNDALISTVLNWSEELRARVPASP